MANIFYPKIEHQCGDNPFMDKPSESDEKKIKELEEIQASIETGYEVLSENVENAVLVIGRTGAGKSTLVNYLIRPEEIRGKKPAKKRRLIIDADELAGYPKIGHGRDAETRFPNKCWDKKNCVAYWDCPGFGDTGGPVKDIPNAFFIKRVFEKAKNVKILLVIDKKDFDSKADAIKTLVDDLTNLFVSVDIIKNAVSLIVTKVGHSHEVKDVKSDISEILKAECFRKPSSGQELLTMLLNSGTAEDKTGAMIKSRVSLFKKPKGPGPIGLDNYKEIIEVVNGTSFVPSPPVKVTVSKESMLYAIHLEYGVKKKLIDHFGELSMGIVKFCSIRSGSVEEMSLIELNSLVEEIPKIKLVVALKCDRVDQLKSWVLAHVDNINNILVKRALVKRLDVSELSEKIDRVSNCLNFLGSINNSDESICNQFSEIYSRMNDGKSQIEDNLKLISGQVKGKLNSHQVAIKALVSSVKNNLFSYIIKDETENKLSSSTKFVKCKEYLDTMQDLKRICTEVTGPDSAFKVIIDTVETELIKKYGLEVPQSATDTIRIYDTFSLIDAVESCAYKKSFQCDLNKMLEDMLKLYGKKVLWIHAYFAKDISRIIKDFWDKLDKWLEKFKEQDDKERFLKETTTILKNLSDSRSDPLTIARDLLKMLKDIGINDSVSSSLELLLTALNNLEKLTNIFDNLKSYPYEKFVQKLKKFSSKLKSRYDKLTHDINIQNNLDDFILDFINDIKEYIIKAKSIELSLENLKKVSEAVDSLINELKDNKDKVISSKNFSKSVLTAFQSVNPDLTKHFKYITEAAGVSRNVITNLTLLKSTLKDDKDWYQSILPEIFLKLNDPNFVVKNDLITLKEITKENFSDILRKFVKTKELQNLMFNNALDIEFSEDRKEQLNALLNASTLDKMKYTNNGSELSIKGNCIRISEIQNLVNEDVKRIKIKSLGSIFFDDNLKANGVDLLIIAPSWHVKSGKNVMIDLSGKTITKLPKAADGKGYAGNGNGQHGMDGLKGLAGNHGGGFYGSGVLFVGLDRLKINVSGGKGQDGQNGGDGARGKPGAAAQRDNNRGQIGQPAWQKSPIESYLSLELIFPYYDKTEKLLGLVGGKGGDSGKGGEGGESGQPGIAKIFGQKENRNLDLGFSIIKEIGSQGVNGCSGQSGEGGKYGDDLEVTYHRVCKPDYKNPRIVTEKIVYVTDMGRKGCVHKTLNKKCSSGHPDKDEKCMKCLHVKFDEEDFSKHVKAFLEKYNILLMNLPQLDFLYKFHQLLLKDLKTELVGYGPKHNNDQYVSLGDNSNKFNQYRGSVIDKLLTLRLGNLSEIRTHVMILNAEYSYVHDKCSGDISRLVTKLAGAFVSGYDVVLVPFNLYNKHWVGLVIKRKQGSILIHYQDPLHKKMPPNLFAKLEESFGSAFPEVNICFTDVFVEKQVSSNCGPELIENFVLYLTGQRVNQYQAVTLHSKLLENNSCCVQQEVNFEHAPVFNDL